MGEINDKILCDVHSFLLVKENNSNKSMGLAIDLIHLKVRSPVSKNKEGKVSHAHGPSARTLFFRARKEILLLLLPRDKIR